MKQKKIISFLIDFFQKNKKKSITVGVILLILVGVIGSNLFIQNSKIAGGMRDFAANSLGAVSESFSPSYEVDFDNKGNDAMLMQKKMAPTMPYPNNNSVGEYDKNIERKVIKNGNLSLVVKDMEVAKRQIESITTEFAGFIQNKNFSENEYKRYNNQYADVRSTISKNGFYEVKIPVENFSIAYEKFRNIALKVTADSVTGRDITEEYLDLETRIKNKKAEEAQYVAILKTAKKVEDVLKVTQYINNTRSEIERLSGRLNYLNNQVSLSTITVNLVAEKDVKVFGVVWSPVAEIEAGFQSFLQDMANFADSAIAFIFKLPVLILTLLVWLLGLTIVWKIIKKIKNKFWKK